MEQSLNPEDDAIISIKNYSYSYPGRSRKVLDKVNLDVSEGQLVALMGRNGAGKSTLCKSLIAVIPHSEGGTVWGSITVNGLNTFKTPVSRMAEELGIVLDDPEAQLFTAKVDDEIAFGVENLNHPVNEIIESLEWAKKVVRLEGFGDREPTALSGGQKQRLVIATALAARPKILVLDEPTSQLDPVGTSEVFDVIHDLKTRYGMTIILSTHKSEHVARYADRIAVLHEGSIIADDTARAVFSNREIMRKAAIHPPQVSELADKMADAGLCSFTSDSYPVLKEDMLSLLKTMGLKK